MLNVRFEAGAPGEGLDFLRSCLLPRIVRAVETRHVHLGDEEAKALRAERPTRPVFPGTYTGLFRAGKMIRVDYPSYIRDHYRFLNSVADKPDGQFLLVGLGMGFVARAALLAGPGTLTIAEKDLDVIQLVRPSLRAEFGDRVRVVHVDVSREPFPRRLDGRPWTMVWLDVWDWPGPQVHDVPMGAWLRRQARRLLAEPEYVSYPRHYELLRGSKNLEKQWGAVSQDRWEEHWDKTIRELLA